MIRELVPEGTADDSEVLTQPKSKNRSDKFSETLIKVISLTCGGGRLKIDLPIKSQAKEHFFWCSSHI